MWSNRLDPKIEFKYNNKTVNTNTVFAGARNRKYTKNKYRSLGPLWLNRPIPIKLKHRVMIFNFYQLQLYLITSARIPLQRSAFITADPLKVCHIRKKAFETMRQFGCK